MGLPLSAGIRDCKRAKATEGDDRIKVTKRDRSKTNQVGNIDGYIENTKAYGGYGWLKYSICSSFLPFGSRGSFRFLSGCFGPCGISTLSNQTPAP